MRMKNRFYEFKNIAENDYSLYVYGEIVGDKEQEFWGSESDVDVADFKKALDDIPNGSNLTMYVNSPGGSVFATSTIISMLNRAKDRGIIINAYIDGVACSCASWLVMVADKINIYKNSMLMIHKPLTFAYGNANDFLKQIEVLDKVEDGVIIPIYESKAKVDKEKIKQMMADETWLTAEEIAQNFNVEFIDEAKEFTNIKSDLFNTYRNTPKEFTQEKPDENMADTSQQEKVKEVIDYSYYENILKELGGINR